MGVLLKNIIILKEKIYAINKKIKSKKYAKKEIFYQSKKKYIWECMHVKNVKYIAFYILTYTHKFYLKTWDKDKI